MKHHILLLGLGFVWGCSGDPKEQGFRDRDPSQVSVQTANATSGISGGSQTDEAHAGQISGNDSEKGALESGGNSAATTGKESIPTAPVVVVVPPISTIQEDAVSPPSKITGAFLVATILPQVDGEPIQVGLVAKKDEGRLSDDPDHFAMNWSLSLGDENLPVSLGKSFDEAYDRILIFEGTAEEFEAEFESIAIHVGVVETKDESTSLNSVISKTLSELFAP